MPVHHRLRFLTFPMRASRLCSLWPDMRPLRFRRAPFGRDGTFDPGGATASRIVMPHMLPSTVPSVSASAKFFLSWLNPPPHPITVYASHPPSPTTAQHSLPGGALPPYRGRSFTGRIASASPDAPEPTGAAVATLVGHTAPVRAVAFSPDGNHVLTGSLDKTARLWSVFSAQDVVDEVKATVPRCMTPNEREHSHLHDASSRWCHARNLWPYLDHGPPEVKGSSPPYGPPSMSLDEKLIGFWDRWTGWLTGSDRQSPASTGLDLTSTGQRRGAAASRAN